MREWWRAALFGCTLVALAPAACTGFKSKTCDAEIAPDGRPPDDLRAHDARSERPALDLRRDGRLDGPARSDSASGSCPSGLAKPTIQSFSITDGIKAVALEQSISLSVKAGGSPKPALTYDFSVTPQADAVKNNGDGTAQWALSSVPPIFFSTKYTIKVTVGYACTGGPTSTSSVEVKVYGNVLVADRKGAAITALASNGKNLGQIVGPGVLTAPSDLVLLSATELAVTDPGSNLVKVIDLKQKTLARSFGNDATGLVPYYLDLTPQGDLLVGFAENKLFRYSPAGKLLQTITTANPYGCAALAHLSDGSIIVGTDGSGKLYRSKPSGDPDGLFAAPPDTGDSETLLPLANDELLFGALTYANYGKLFRLSKTGAVLQTVNAPATSYSFRYLRHFAGGYLFIPGNYNSQIYRLDQTLKVASAPFATVSAAYLGGMAWLDL